MVVEEEDEGSAAGEETGVCICGALIFWGDR
jgi:hypothetical protein